MIATFEKIVDMVGLVGNGQLSESMLSISCRCDRGSHAAGGTSINSSIPLHKKTSTPNRQIMDGLPSTGQLGVEYRRGTPPGSCLPVCSYRTVHNTYSAVH